MEEQILQLVGNTPGLTDRELAENLGESNAARVNSIARRPRKEGRITRVKKYGYRIRNYLPKDAPSVPEVFYPHGWEDEELSEQEVVRLLGRWLQKNHWETRAAAGRAHGIDIVAKKNGTCWLIEAKGCGSQESMRGAYFQCVLGNILQRMKDDASRYSIAFPYRQTFWRLWHQLPALAKERTKITALFVRKDGTVKECS